MLARIVCAVVTLGSLTAAAHERPNILVVYSDDHGWADLAIQGVDRDIRTPNLDQLARDGVRFTRGYVSAPQCVPSRAGLITGRYQQRFGVEDNNHGPLPLSERTIAELLAPAGSMSGWIGKCHLDVGGEKRKGEGYRVLPDHMPHRQGFAEYFRGELRRYEASHDLQGRPFPDAPHRVVDERFRVEVQTEAALSFLDRRAKAPGQPWFLYLAWYAPHVPLESPEPWFSRTPESLPLERRQALAMVAAMDDGLGRIREKLRAMGAETNTLIVFAGDNGAPLGKAWNGSLNGPLIGQKGMLAEGGIRTPFIGAWPGTWPAGVAYDEPVINLDIAATAIAAAGLAPDPSLDGVDLTPFVTGRKSGSPHERLFWRWGSQAAVLEMPYKLIVLGDRVPLLFDVSSPAGEHHDRDLAASHPEIVARLMARLEAWAADLQPPGLSKASSGSGRHHEQLFAEHHLTALATPKKEAPTATEPAARAAPAAKKPNVVVFLVDDMGWMDSSPYGSRYYDTPNIARLAGQGMRFTRAYSQPLCSPTRASLLTGKNAARHGITSAVGHKPPKEGSLADSGPPNAAILYPESKTFLDPSERTLAEALRDAGYRTGHFGKWHLGITKPHWPEAQGFDVAFHCHPDPGPPGAYFSPYGVSRPGKEPAPGTRRVVGTITDGPPGEYITDRLTDEAIRFVETSVRDHAGRPFFLNLWHYGVHGPWGHKESLTAAMANRTDPTGRQDNPVMASMLASIDESLGRLLDALDRLGIADDTIVVFTSDNGGNTHSMTEESARKKGTADEGDPTVASYRKWAGFKPPTNNAPLRDGKGTLYEGGVRVPLVVRFPGRIQPGTTSDALVGCTDVYPTLLDLAGLATDPAQVKDGISYADVLRGTAARARDAYVIWFPGRAHGAIAYSGDWKLIRREEPAAQGDGSTRELFNLKDDLGETKNLAAEHPAKVQELEAVIERQLADAGTLIPRPNPVYRGKPLKAKTNAVDAAAR